MLNITPIEKLPSSHLVQLAKQLHDRNMRAFDLCQCELDFECNYSVFVFDGCKNIPFIRQALIAFRDSLY